MLIILKFSRCLQITNSSLLFYAGAGITEDSDPEKEWQETEMKANTLSNVIEKVYLQEQGFLSYK